MDGFVRIGVQGPHRGGDVGRLRVVDIANAVQLADELEAVRHSWEGAERVRDLLVVDAGSARCRGRRGGVLAVVPATDQRLGGEWGLRRKAYTGDARTGAGGHRADALV